MFGLLLAATALAPPPTLLPDSFHLLRLGSVRAEGWLLTQLKQQATTLSGHLNLFWPDVNESVWIGGTYDHSGAGHERGPYWLNGIVPLSALLNSSGVVAPTPNVHTQMEQWIHYILAHQNKTTGWLGPDDGFGGPGNAYWSAWNVVHSLLQYADAKQGQPIAATVYAAVLAHVKEATRRQKKEPFTSWTQNRWQDWVYLVHWLWDVAPQGHEQVLHDAAALTFAQRWDWAKYYKLVTDPSFPHSLPDTAVPAWTMYDHGVNNAQGTKWAAVWYRQSGDASLLPYTRKMLDMQAEHHGQPHGMFSADECFGGRELNRGIELCAVVEQLYSLQVAFRATGEIGLLDDIERIAFNALPATMTASMWQHQYLQQANEVSACPTTPHVWQSDGPDSTVFGVEPNFGCCTANFNQGWPKLAHAALLTKHEDGGVVVALLLPVAADLPGGATVHVETQYPNGDSVSVHLAVPEGKAAMPLYVRVPGWADKATYVVNDPTGAKQRPAPNGTFVRAECAAGRRLSLTLTLNPQVRVEKGWGGRAGRRTNPKTGVDAHGFSEWNGSLPAGGDVHTANVTVQEAEAWCSASATCVAFTLSSAKPVLANTTDGAAPADNVEVETGKDHRASHAHHGHAHHGDGDRRVRAQTLPPPAAPLGMLGPPPSSPPTIYFKGAWNPNTDGGWRSYAKVAAAQDTNALAVVRGPLLFALRVKQEAAVVKTWQPYGNVDINVTTPSIWNYALLVDVSDPASSLTFERMPAKDTVAFNSSAPLMRIKASAVELGEWRAALDAADEPPPSPLTRPAGGKTVDVELIPYGATELRMAALPWVAL